jgi:hypothetical protein
MFRSSGTFPLFLLLLTSSAGGGAGVEAPCPMVYSFLLSFLPFLCVVVYLLIELDAQRWPMNCGATTCTYRYTNSHVVFIVCCDLRRRFWNENEHPSFSERPILYVHATELYVCTEMLSQSVRRILVH